MPYAIILRIILHTFFLDYTRFQFLLFNSDLLNLYLPRISFTASIRSSLILYGMELNTLCIFNKFSRILIIILQCIFVLLCKFFCLLQGHSFFPPSLIFLLDSTFREICPNFLFLHSFSNFLYQCNICR